MHLFYCPSLLTGAPELPEEEAHHARTVLRLSAGTSVGLLDGRGAVAEAEITAIDKRHLSFRITSKKTIPTERTSRIHLVVAPTKQMERFEWMLEKCTEIGVDHVTPLLTERTERSRLRHDRLQRVMISAMKQSQRAWLPDLDEASTIKDLIDRGIPAQRWFGWCEGERTMLTTSYRPSEDVILLIGPEGDFTPEESQELIGHGFGPVSLGAARLRTETAAMVACTWMNLAQETLNARS